MNNNKFYVCHVYDTMGELDRNIMSPHRFKSGFDAFETKKLAEAWMNSQKNNPVFIKLIGPLTFI